MNIRQGFLKLFFVMFFIICLSVWALDEANPAVFEYDIVDNHVVITGLVEEPKDIVIPSIINDKPVTIIGNRAFANRLNITMITIPESITSIGDDAMAGCKSLEAIYVNEKNPYFASSNGMLFNKDKSKLIACPSGKKDEYVVERWERNGYGHFARTKVGYNSLQDSKCVTLGKLASLRVFKQL